MSKINNFINKQIEKRLEPLVDKVLQASYSVYLEKTKDLELDYIKFCWLVRDKLDDFIPNE